MDITVLYKSLSYEEKKILMAFLLQDGFDTNEMTLVDWLEHALDDLSIRLFRGLANSYDRQYPGELLKDVTKEKFLKCLGLGEKTWQEFEEKRKHFL